MSLYILYKNKKIFLSKDLSDFTLGLSQEEFFNSSLQDLESMVGYHIKNIVVTSEKYDDPLEEKELYLKVLNHIKLFNLESIDIIPLGEPFIYYQDILDFLKTLSNKNIRQINFTTSATLLTKKKINKLFQLQQTSGVKYLFIVSVDGITKKQYESISHFSFKKILKIIKWLQKCFDIRIKYTLKSELNNNSLISIFSFFNKRKILSRSIIIDVDTTHGFYSDEEKEKILKQFKNMQRICSF